MLGMLREAARTWVAKVLFFVLVLSFGVWGVSGSMFSPGGDAVVTVGDTEVSANEFRLAYDRQMSLVSQRFGTRLTREQARALGIENQVYAQLVAGAALDEQAKAMNLGLSRDRLAGLIAEDPAFQGIDGRFNRQNFSAVLQNAGLTEEEYITDREQAAVRTQIVEALSDGFAAPQTMVDAFIRHRSETRTVEYIVLDASTIEPVGEPSEEELAAYFEENAARYRAPEYRNIAYVEISPETLADPETISDEAVRADYEANRERYAGAERRTIDQLIFSDRQAAEEASAALENGSSFEDLVEAEGRTLQDARLGTFTQENMSSPALGEAAFSVAEEGGVTDVVDGPFGPVILRIAAIERAEAPALEEVSAEIRQELALAEGGRLLFDVYNAYEDARAGGASVEEAAREQQLQPVVIEAIDQTGRTPDGEIVSDIPQSSELLSEAFESDVGVDAAPLNLDGNGYVGFEVLDIEPARERTLDEVRDEVVADWRAEQTAATLGGKASTLRQRIVAGEDLSAIAAEEALQVETKYGLQRDSQDPVFGDSAIEAAFAGPRGHVAVAGSEDGASQLVMQVTDILSTGGQSLAPEESEAISARSADDILDQVIVRLQTQYPVSINRTLGERALSF